MIMVNYDDVHYSDNDTRVLTTEELIIMMIMMYMIIMISEFWAHYHDDNDNNTLVWWSISFNDNACNDIMNIYLSNDI